MIKREHILLSSRLKTTDADKYEPKAVGEKVEVGEKVDLTDNVTNLPELPKRNESD